VAKAFDAGSHGSTFGGNPLVTAAGNAVLKTYTETPVIEKSLVMAEALKQGLEKLKVTYPNKVLDVRGKGLLLGLVTADPAIEIVNQARDHKLLILTAGPNVIRILPPLTASLAEVNMCLNILDQILSE
jgi:acetylornithine aminotransferase